MADVSKYLLDLFNKRNEELITNLLIPFLYVLKCIYLNYLFTVHFFS